MTANEKADRAATVLGVHHDLTQGAEPFMGETYGDEGSDTFRAAVVDLLTDLKYLLVRTGDYNMMLEDLAAEAVDRWADDEEDEEDG